jgi:nicotinamide mononucleotide (NMN) deamidase PncC
MLEQIQGFFTRFGSIMADNNRRQAYLPEGCIPIENPVGTAPGFIVEDDRGTIITLPGVPHEMRYLMEHAVTPYLQGVLGPRSIMVTRILRTVALGESRIDRAIADLETSTNPTVGLSAHRGQTDVRIVAKASSQSEAEALLDDFEARIRERLGAAIYATGDATLEAVVAGLLRERAFTLAVAETHSLGDITRRLSSEPDVFAGGLVAYEGGQLARLLDLPAESIAGEAGAAVLAESVRQRLGASHGLAVLSDEPDGPWVAVASDEGSKTIRLRYSERDRRARIWTTASSLDYLRRLLLGLAEGWEP